jgi:hypothetical protein
VTTASCWRLAVSMAAAASLLPVPALAVGSSAQLQINVAGTGLLQSAAPGNINGAVEAYEIDPASIGDDPDGDLPGIGGDAAAASAQSLPQPFLNRRINDGEGNGESCDGKGPKGDQPEVRLSFNGMNHRDQRLANGGNQFSLEPPDQGLCVGNGFVVETINDVIQVWDTKGNPLTGPVALNSFYGYAPAIVRATGAFGPDITDPSCLYDPATRRWFHVVLTLDRVGTTSALNGKNHLDIAVSTTSDPRGSWLIYHLPVQNDGTDGTPNHGCTLGPCLGDYPHIGANRDAIFLTTNEFSLFGPGFFGAQVYALSKKALIQGSGPVPVVMFNTGDPSVPEPGFTLWPAQGSGGDDGGSNGGGNREFLMSSLAVFFGTSNQILVWSVNNTNSIDKKNPSLTLDVSAVNTLTYGIPPRSTQKAGDFPQGQCYADNTMATPFGPGCWRFFFVSGGPFPNVEKKVDSNDSRMQQVTYTNGKLWGALDTAVTVQGVTQAGIAYFVINPNSGKVVTQGVVAVPGNNVTYPAIGVNGSGRGVMAFTLLGNDHYPSAAYTPINAKSGAGDIHIVAEGLGPDDGFTGYNPTSVNGTRPRWGDYGAAAVDGDDIWIASEYIGQTCDLATYVASGFSCGATRTSLANWFTRITKLDVDD